MFFFFGFLFWFLSQRHESERGFCFWFTSVRLNYYFVFGFTLGLVNCVLLYLFSV